MRHSLPFAPAKRALFALLLGLSIVAGGDPRADACEGTYRPTCGRSIWLAMSTDSSVVHPGAGNPITVPIRLYPYLLWNTTAGCAQPSQPAVLGVVLECTPDDGGPTINVPVQLVPMATPGVPGIQEVLTGPAMSPEVGGPYDFVIPADTLPAGTTYRCNIQAEFQSAFASGVGAGLLSATADSVVCIVGSSPADSSIAALQMDRLLPDGSDGLVRCRRGDQGVFQYLLANNHPTLGVALEFLSTSTQVARLPTLPDPTETAFAISSPKNKTDAFPICFSDLADPGRLLDEGDPTKKDDHEIKRPIYLSPGEVRIVSICGRSHGMCQDGSCSQMPAEVIGTWDDGASARACASAVMMVDDVDAKTPLYEVTDSMKACDTTDTLWSKTTFDGDSHRVTHGPGNLSKDEGGPGTQVTGMNLQGPLGYPNTASDYLRMQDAPNSAKFKVDAFPQAENFNKMSMSVTIKNLAHGTSPLNIPLFKKPNGAKFGLTIDLSDGSAVLKDSKKKKTLFKGLYANLLSTPPKGVFIESDTFREFTWSFPDGVDYLCTLPGSHAETIYGSTNNATFHVLDPRDHTALPWTASSNGLAVTPVVAMGVAGDDLDLVLDETNTAAFPDVSVTWVTLTTTGAMNSPYSIPIATRTMTGDTPGALIVDDVIGKVALTGEKAKDEISITARLDIPADFEPKGEILAFYFLNRDLIFKLDKKGKQDASKKEKKVQTLTIDYNKVGGVIQPGPTDFTVKLRKSDLSGAFAQFGVHKDSTPGVPILTEIPIIARLFKSTSITRTKRNLMIFVTPKLIAVVEDA